ncbi:MAG: hypothetical protein ABIE07_09765 [Candidatus Zixiibacteriota bacterium]
MSFDAAKELGKKYAIYMASFRAEIINEGLSEHEAMFLLNRIAVSCTPGYMETVGLPEIRALDK